MKNDDGAARIQAAMAWDALAWQLKQRSGRILIKSRRPTFNADEFKAALDEALRLEAALADDRTYGD